MRTTIAAAALLLSGCWLDAGAYVSNVWPHPTKPGALVLERCHVRHSYMGGGMQGKENSDCELEVREAGAPLPRRIAPTLEQIERERVEQAPEGARETK